MGNVWCYKLKEGKADIAGTPRGTIKEFIGKDEEACMRELAGQARETNGKAHGGTHSE